MKTWTKYVLAAVAVAAVCVAAHFAYFRIDLTGDKRYSLSEPTKRLVKSLDEPLQVDIYLTGRLNPGFVRLQKATTEMLDELGRHAGSQIVYRFVQPVEKAESSTDLTYEQLAENGLTPSIIYDSEDGRSTQTIVFPYALMTYKGRSQAVALLKNVRGRSGEENLNASVETLEYELTDAIRRLTRTSASRIAFIEGHGELDELSTYDISRALSRYFQIDRGVIGHDLRELMPYKALIIASPQTAFSNRDKYLLDQYVMHGGRILWLIDGVRFDMASLSTEGLTPAIPLDVNLTDLLFRYGVRITGGLLQDEQCLPVPVNMAVDGAAADFQPVPWYYAPVLLTSPVHPVSRNVMQVSATFCSTVESVGEAEQPRRDYILFSSAASHIIPTPAKVDLNPMQASDEYFNRQYLPVGMTLDGVFQSAFAHRVVPDSVEGVTRLNESVPTRQVVIACGNIISNAVQNGQPLPLGYDRYTQTQFGNRDLLLNAVLYLADDEDWINLRSKEFTLHLLNKTAVRQRKTWLQLLNVGLPLLLLLLFGAGFNLSKKHARKNRSRQ